jgi:hypothetical protein
MNSLIRFTLAIAAMAAVTLSASAQNATRIPRYTDDQKPHEWYADQARLWQAETERDPHNADAWFNYYRAVRYVGITSPSPDWEKQRERADQIADAMERAVPNTHQYHKVKWSIGGNDRSLFYHLERAVELNPDYAEHAPDLICYYETGGDHDRALSIARKWYETRALSPSLFEYTQNVLASLEPNAVIFTAGDLDTYPIWILQAARGVRPDVTVVNTSLMLIPEYCEWLLDDQGIKGDASLLDWAKIGERSVEQAQAEFVRSVATMTTERPVYTALTMEPGQVKLIENDLYVIGLANRYSPKRIDNVALLERNWRKFRLDYLDGMQYSESYGFDTSWLPQMNLNYVTPALLLFEHCSTAGRSTEAQAYRDMLMEIGREAGREKELAEHMATIDGSAAKESAGSVETVRDASEESAFARSITLFPNPATRQVSVNLPSAMDATMRIVGLDGVVVRELATTAQTTTIDLTTVPSGSYLLKVTTASAEATKRIEIKR